MPAISLSSGALATVDDADFQFVNRWKWKQHSAGYAYRTIRVGGRAGGWKNLYLHHLILPLTPGLEVDHINRNKLDNRRANLRLVCHSVNSHNRTMLKNSRGSQGVTKPKGRNRWAAKLYVNGQYRWLGSFKTQAEAETAYADARRQLLGA